METYFLGDEKISSPPNTVLGLTTNFKIKWNGIEENIEIRVL